MGDNLNVQQEADRISRSLDSMAMENYEVPAVIDETFDVSLTVPLYDTFEAPINTTVPVSTSIVIDENNQRAY